MNRFFDWLLIFLILGILLGIITFFAQTGGIG